jgi:hypothetical protein
MVNLQREVASAAHGRGFIGKDLNLETIVAQLSGFEGRLVELSTGV